MDPSNLLLSASHAKLIVIDVQERLLPVIRHHARVAASIRFLMDAALILNVPAIVTEQYPKGLGQTVDLLRNHPATVQTLEKIRFSAAEVLGSYPAASTFKADGPRQVVLVGIESHICVQQTALDLRDKGIAVFVASDAVGSRFIEDHEIALRRMAAAGVTISTCESFAFEWCRQAGTESFKALSRLVRDRDLHRSS